MFSLELPYRGDSNVYTQYTIFNVNKKNTLNLQLWEFFQGTQERVRNSRGKRAIGVRATEVLLCSNEGKLFDLIEKKIKKRNPFRPSQVHKNL